MEKYGNFDLKKFFSKLLNIEESILFDVDLVLLNNKSIKIIIFNRYKFLKEEIILKELLYNGIDFCYDGKSYEILHELRLLNKKYSKTNINVFLSIVLKNLIDGKAQEENYIVKYLLSNNKYQEFSFLLGNINRGVSNQTYSDIMKFNFLEDYLSRRNERDGIEIKASICIIEHAEAECTYCNAQSLLKGDVNLFYNLGNNFSIDYSYFKPRKKYVYDSFTTYLTQNETIVGGATNKIEEIFENIDYEKYDYIHVNLCCLPTIIGDDLTSIVARYNKKSQIPIIYTNQTSINPYKVLKELLDSFDTEEKKIKDTCAFIGFPHQRGLYELKNILVTYGIEVKEILLPIIEIDSLKSLQNIEKLALIDTGRSEDAIKLFESSNTFRTVSPFGFNNSITFLKQILKEYGKEFIYTDYLSEKINIFNNYKKSNNLEIGFILLPSNLKSFLGNFRGVDILNILIEMGFKINIFYYIDKNSEYIDSIENIIKAKIPKENLSNIIMSDLESDLEDFIKNEKIDLYYSEIKDDKRILKYRKQYFSTSILESGLDGIIRSLSKLIKLGELSKNLRNIF